VDPFTTSFTTASQDLCPPVLPPDIEISLSGSTSQPNGGIHPAGSEVSILFTIQQNTQRPFSKVQVLSAENFIGATSMGKIVDQFASTPLGTT
jgi:hypothetical protein